MTAMLGCGDGLDLGKIPMILSVTDRIIHMSVIWRGGHRNRDHQFLLV